MRVNPLLPSAALVRCALLWFCLGGTCAALAAGDPRGTALEIRQDGRCLDISGTPPAREGARVSLWRCDGSPGQRWQVDGDRIRQHTGDRCLEVNAADLGDEGARVQVGRCRDAVAQAWRIERGRISNRADDRCLTVYAPDAGRDGAHVEMFDCSGRATSDRHVDEERAYGEGLQRWTLQPVGRAARTRDVEAGPLWNNADAAQKCPDVCAPDRWRGAWRTTIPGRMSVCGCELSEDHADEDGVRPDRSRHPDDDIDRPLSEARFSALLSAMAAELSTDAKLRVLDVAAAHNLFNVAQLRRVIDALPFAGDRMRAVELLAPRVVDPENAYTLLDAFSFDSEKAQVREAFAPTPRR